MLKILMPVLALLIISSPETVGMNFPLEQAGAELARALMAGLLLLPALRRITGL